MNRRKRKKQVLTKTVSLSLVILLLLLFLIFIFFTIHFQSHFFFRTQLNGLSVSNMTLEEAQDKLKTEADSYLLTIFDRDGNKYHISASDIDYTYIPGSEEGKLLEGQKSWQWIRGIFSPQELTLKTTVNYDQALLSSAVSSLSCFQAENIIEPVNATITETEDGYTITSEIMGTHMLFDTVLSDVALAVSSGESELTLSDKDYLAPEILSTDTAITTCLSNIEQFLSTTITYDITGSDEVLDRTTTKDWIQIDENYNVSISDYKVTSYVQALASKYNTYADVRNFVTSRGDVVQIGGGDYGWIVDKDKESAQIKTDLASGTAISREPVYQQRAISREADDIGKSYVEIDYSNQHLWYYKDGALVTESDIVSGNISNGNGSPDGIFKIVYRQSPAVLKGEDYESNVTYFMPFAYNVGIHDASWRNAFGKTIYIRSGSHGCVNVPLECATAIYEAIDVGTPVVAYYRTPVSLTSKSAKISNAYSYVDPEVQDTTTPGTEAGVPAASSTSLPTVQ